MITPFKTSERISDQIWNGLFVFLFVLALRQVPLAIENWIERAPQDLSEGTYVLSAGTPQTLCELSIGPKTIDSNRMGAETTLSSLDLATTFHSSDLLGTDRTIALNCEKPKGFSFIVERPRILPAFGGIAIKLYKNIERIILPPLVCLLILISTFQVRTRTIRSHRVVSLILFLTALIYSGVLLFFIEPPAQLFLKTFAACAVGFITLYWQRTQAGRYSFLVLIPAWITLIFGLVSIFAPVQQEWVRLGVIYGVTAVGGLASCLFTFRTPSKSQTIVLLRSFSVFWTLSMIALSLGAFTQNELISPPVVIATIALFVHWAKELEFRREQRVEASISHVRRAIDLHKPIPESFSALGEVILQETHFARISAYIDAYAVGLHERPGERFIRVMENGYQKDTLEDRIIDFRQERGLKMKTALTHGNLLLQKGQSDHAWFLCVPLGRYVCLNLSDHLHEPEYLAHESLEIVSRFHSTMLRFNERLMQYALKSGFALERLRTYRGEGKWDEEIGVVFVDFRNNSQRFHPSIEETILPALTRTVGRLGVRDLSKNDEICFLVFPELGDSPHSLPRATSELTQAISLFLKKELPDLEADLGLSDLQPVVASGFGKVSVSCDAIDVRVSGPVISEVRTLRDFADEHIALISYDLGVLLGISNGDSGKTISISTKRGQFLAFAHNFSV